MAMEQSFGPLMRQCSGGSPTTVATCWTTTVREWTKTTNTPTTARRPRPATAEALLSSMTPRTANRQEVRRTFATGDYGNYRPGYAAGYFTDHSSMMAATEQEAIQKVQLKVKNETFNVGVFLGELPETQRFFVDVGKALFKSYKAVRRGDLKTLHRMWFPRYKREPYRGRYGKPITDSYGNIVVKPIVDRAAKMDLAWRYAVSPMINDLDSAFKELYARSQSKVRIMRSSASATGRFYYSEVSPFGLQSSKAASWKKTATLYYSVNTKVDGWKRLGLLNPLAVLWELVPLSFVLDWFVPVGRYLSSLDAMAGTSLLGRTLSTRETQHASVSGKHPDGMSQLPATWDYTSYSRNTSFSMTLSPPKFKPNLTLQRQVDASALVWQQMSRKLR